MYVAGYRSCIHPIANCIVHDCIPALEDILYNDISVCNIVLSWVMILS